MAHDQNSAGWMVALGVGATGLAYFLGATFADPEWMARMRAAFLWWRFVEAAATWAGIAFVPLAIGALFIRAFKGGNRHRGW